MIDSSRWSQYPLIAVGMLAQEWPPMTWTGRVARSLVPLGSEPYVPRGALEVATSSSTSPRDMCTVPRPAASMPPPGAKAPLPKTSTSVSSSVAVTATKPARFVVEGQASAV